MSKKAHTAMDEVKDGEFVRTESEFRNFVKKDGSTPYIPEANRYLLYVALACPWASRCLAARRILGLEDSIDVVVTNSVFRRTRPDDPKDTHSGWCFPVGKRKCGVESDIDPGANLDPIFGAETIREIYEKCGDTKGKYTVPILFDKKTKTIVSNESAEILRMLYQEFDEIAKTPLNLYPSDLADTIEQVNAWVYPSINNGVYRSGFAKTQAAYDAAVTEVFEHLDKAEAILSKQRYLCDNERFTEADLRLFVTLVRFDLVYHQHFKCNKKVLYLEYPNLHNFTLEIYQMQGVKQTVDFWHIRNHYHRSHESINPLGIVPIGPSIDFDAPHDRDRFSK